MALRKTAFPFPFRLGTDICNLGRIERIIVRGQAMRFASRILHPDEITDLDRRVPDWTSIKASSSSRRDKTGSLSELRNFLGGRWAAKEAARKALGARTLGQKDVRVQVQPQGEVEVLYERKDVTGEIVEQACLCTISHENSYAVATVIAPLVEPKVSTISTDIHIT